MRKDGGILMTTPSSKKLVLVKNFPVRPLAEAARQALQQNGIEAVIQSSDIVGTASYQGVDLYVQEKDAATAHQMLDSLYDGI
jgi:hypothetical protein